MYDAPIQNVKKFMEKYMIAIQRSVHIVKDIRGEFFGNIFNISKHR